MIKYRKKPVVIEAIQFLGSQTALNLFLGDKYTVVMWDEFGVPEQISIPTLEGNHLANIGDFIIKGVKGEFYPCKPDIFKMTYDLVEDV